MTPGEMEEFAKFLDTRDALREASSPTRQLPDPGGWGTLPKFMAAAGVIIGALIGGAALVDTFLWTEAEAAAHDKENVAQHEALADEVAENRSVNDVQDVKITNQAKVIGRVDRNLQALADRFNVRGVERAP